MIRTADNGFGALRRWQSHDQRVRLQGHAVTEQCLAQHTNQTDWSVCSVKYGRRDDGRGRAAARLRDRSASSQCDVPRLDFQFMRLPPPSSSPSSWPLSDARSSSASWVSASKSSSTSYSRASVWRHLGLRSTHCGSPSPSQIAELVEQVREVLFLVGGADDRG